ncbi:hypothetical protein Phi18:3_gp067 [Cellulophaga phage phi18:3]|uniref:Uncharacterized protein n=1 Tax=Cellulophaga phage phi18:3 TaxID=1327983 RepID=R9ZZ14_9CAUD|nr:hypothetical protein Phi18:3_gp067 [Cellulophaga phage phi18:3]AGO48579.1 hypothetical protein Phi18:3_gp067 [Cellulophaga phage phi18:3]
MTAKELLKPRFEVIAVYPLQKNEIGYIYETGENCIEYIVDSDKFDLREYPHLFRRLNWWEYRTKEQMPKKLKSMFCKDFHNFDLDKEDVYNILDWDMNGMMGYLNIEKREVCDLTQYKPEYGYIPVD